MFLCYFPFPNHISHFSQLNFPTISRLPPNYFSTISQLPPHYFSTISQLFLDYFPLEIQMLVAAGAIALTNGVVTDG